MSTLAATTVSTTPSAASRFLRTRIGAPLKLWFQSATSGNVYSASTKAADEVVGTFGVATGSIHATLPISRTITIQLAEGTDVSATLTFAITSESAASDTAKVHHVDLIGGSGTYKNRRGYGTLTMTAANTPGVLDVMTFVR
jgi:hypothetical protein